jgi:hypothetical protein
MRDYTSKVNDTAPLQSGILDAAEFNSFANELENAVTKSGVTLDAATGPDTSAEMLAQSMTRHVGSSLACVDSGSANTYVLAMIGNYVAPTALVAEMRIRFRPGTANSGASTVNAFSLGSKALVDHTLAPLSGGELEVGREAEAIYRPSVGAGSWVLPAWANALYVDPSPTAPTEIGDGEGWSVDTGDNSGNLNFPGLTNSGTLAPTDIFARHVDSVGHRGITGAQLLAALSGSGGGLINVRLLTNSGTYVKTPGTNRIIIFATGGGGGGGAGRGGAEGAGGAGGGTDINFSDVSELDDIAYTIGIGGPGGVAANGSNGGSTIFSTFANATGGEGGNRPSSTSSSNPSRGGKAGIGTLGLMRLSGGDGHHSAADESLAGANGGSSFWSGGGRGGIAKQAVAPEAGRGYGAGGGGGDGTSSSQLPSDQNGASGSPGCILILEFA